MILYLKIIPEVGDEVHEACSQLKQNNEKKLYMQVFCDR